MSIRFAACVVGGGLFVVLVLGKFTKFYEAQCREPT